MTAPTRLVVVGDTLLDRDVDGSAERLCPDAPALVLTEQATTDRPGGAGLAATLAAAAGYDVTLVTALAGDAGGRRLRELLAAAGVAVSPFPLPGATPEKIRFRADGRVMLRLDRGGGDRSPGPPAGEAAEAVRAADAVLVSDYGGGVTHQPAVRAAVSAAGGPVVWDPHPRGAPAVADVRLITPSESELATLAGDAPAAPTGPPVPTGPTATTGSAGRARPRRLADTADRAQWLRRRWRAAAVAVTLGADGALLCHPGPTPLVVPAPDRAAGDPCGAGDRFAAAAAAALAGGALVSEAVERAVAAATEYVNTGGVHRPTDPAAFDSRPAAGRDAAELVDEVRRRAGTVVATGGCFDLLHAGHVATLEAARGLGDCLVVCVNSDASVSRLKGSDRPLVPQADRVRLLAALGCVDAVVVFDEPTPQAVLSRLRPDVWVKGGDYAGGDPAAPDLPEAELVRGWGGQTVVVPYLDGRSTTGMIDAARAGRRPGGVTGGPAGRVRSRPRTWKEA